MIDAGSTGSRIHVYKFNYCSPSPMLEYEVFSQTRPGLSSFKNDPKEAAGSLNVLMAEAMRVVPESLRSCTPLAVKATAGLRLLGKKQSQAILKEVEHHLGSDFPFPLIPTDPVVIMDGKDEGQQTSSSSISLPSQAIVI
jgi:guanosine-diphosphatase